MKKIILPRGKGKTTELIKMAHEDHLYILTTTMERAGYIYREALEMDLEITFPIHWADFEKGRLNGSIIKDILIDDADDLLRVIFRGLNIKAITMTEEVSHEGRRKVKAVLRFLQTWFRKERNKGSFPPLG